MIPDAGEEYEFLLGGSRILLDLVAHTDEFTIDDVRDIPLPPGGAIAELVAALLVTAATDPRDEDSRAFDQFFLTAPDDRDATGNYLAASMLYVATVAGHDLFE
jgi:hypothetical protein